MINLRYHIVSLTAVFLALAIGVAMGTGFLNKATVEQLRRQINKAEGGIDKANDENAQLREDLERAAQTDQALLASGELLVSGRLSDVPVLVVASENIDQGSLTKLRTLLAQSGADLRGTLTISDRLRLDAGDDDQLAEILNTPAKNRPVLQIGLTTAFAGALRESADRPPESEATSSPLVADLVEAKYLGYQTPDDAPEGLDASTMLAGGGFRYVFVSGPDPRTPDVDFLLPVLRSMAADGPAPVVVASAAVGDEAEQTRTASVGAIRNDTSLRDELSTVDDLERLSGLLATLLALDDLDAGIRGHYGLGAGRQSELPGST
ncbi:MAG: copper transporter [Acidimicrobiia bacterium]|nr:copper transporter [Acidimicrobiia bacterium]